MNADLGHTLRKYTYQLTHQLFLSVFVHVCVYRQYCKQYFFSVALINISLLLARDSEERERWIRALEDTIKRHSQARKVCIIFCIQT